MATFTAADTASAMPADLVEARKALDAVLKENNFLEPDRGDLSKYASEVWRTGKPDYTVANMAYCKGKTKNHLAGSLELVVENLVKTWEMEASHVKDTKAWTTIDHSAYKASANGGHKYPIDEASKVGNYNILMDNTDKKLYDASKETFESSHHTFRHAFPEGFPWELLEVFSGPPKVAFTWRHWATFSGEYKGHKGDGQTVEMYGFCVATVDANLKVQELEVFYKPEDFLRVLEGKAHGDTISHGKSIVGSGCPIMKGDVDISLGACPMAGGSPNRQTSYHGRNPSVFHKESGRNRRASRVEGCTIA